MGEVGERQVHEYEQLWCGHMLHYFCLRECSWIQRRRRRPLEMNAKVRISNWGWWIWTDLAIGRFDRAIPTWLVVVRRCNCPGKIKAITTYSVKNSPGGAGKFYAVQKLIPYSHRRSKHSSFSTGSKGKNMNAARRITKSRTHLHRKSTSQSLRTTPTSTPQTS